MSYNILLDEIAKGPSTGNGLGAVPSLDSYIDSGQPFFEDPNYDSTKFGQYGAPWWSGIVTQGIATTPAIIAASKKSPIPGYPGSTPVYSEPTYLPRGGLTSGGSGINLSGGISTNTLMIIGLGAALFLVGSSRGRR